MYSLCTVCRVCRMSSSPPANSSWVFLQGQEFVQTLNVLEIKKYQLWQPLIMFKRLPSFSKIVIWFKIFWLAMDTGPFEVLIFVCTAAQFGLKRQPLNSFNTIYFWRSRNSLNITWPFKKRLESDSELEKSIVFVNQDFFGIQISRKKCVSYSNLELRHNCVNHKFGKKYGKIL